MKIDMTDEKLKELFGKMRLEDENGMPVFEQVVPRSVTVIRSFSSAWRFAAVMVLVILLGAGTETFFVFQPQTGSSIESTYENWSALSSWKAATDNMSVLATVKIDGTLTTATDALLETVCESGSVAD